MVIISQAPGGAQVTAATGGVFQSTAGGQLNMPIPGSGRLEGRKFTIRHSGVVTFAAGTYTAAVTAIIYGGVTLATAGAGNALYSATANVVRSATVSGSIPYFVEADIEGDSLSATIQGVGEGAVNNTAQARAAIAQAPTTVNFTTEPPLVFAAGVTVASQASAVILDSFTLEA